MANIIRTGQLIAPYLLGFAIITLVACSPTPSDPSVASMKISGPTMGTRYNITVVGLSDDEASVKTEIDQELSRITQIMSTYEPSSELMKLNSLAANEWHSLSEDLSVVVHRALSIYQLSNQEYDVTIGPLVNLWGFGPKASKAVPTDVEISKAKTRVGSEYIQLNKNLLKLKKTEPVFIDLSSIAKGYGVDKIAELLIEKGATGFLVEVGGEVRTYGTNAQQKLWRIGIERPSLAHSGAQLVVELNNQSVATSGDYRNYFEVKGEPFSHIISPKTGRPVTHQLASATVIADSSMDSDGLATAFLVLGEAQALAIANENNIPLYLISYNDKSFRVSYSQAFEPFLSIGAKK